MDFLISNIYQTAETVPVLNRSDSEEEFEFNDENSSLFNFEFTVKKKKHEMDYLFTKNTSSVRNPFTVLGQNFTNNQPSPVKQPTLTFTPTPTEKCEFLVNANTPSESLATPVLLPLATDLFAATTSTSSTALTTTRTLTTSASTNLPTAVDVLPVPTVYTVASPNKENLTNDHKAEVQSDNKNETAPRIDEQSKKLTHVQIWTNALSMMQRALHQDHTNTSKKQSPKPHSKKRRQRFVRYPKIRSSITKAKRTTKRRRRRSQQKIKICQYEGCKQVVNKLVRSAMGSGLILCNACYAFEKRNNKLVPLCERQYGGYRKKRRQVADSGSEDDSTKTRRTTTTTSTTTTTTSTTTTTTNTQRHRRKSKQRQRRPRSVRSLNYRKHEYEYYNDMSQDEDYHPHDYSRSKSMEEETFTKPSVSRYGTRFQRQKSNNRTRSTSISPARTITPASSPEMSASVPLSTMSSGNSISSKRFSLEKNPLSPKKTQNRRATTLAPTPLSHSYTSLAQRSAEITTTGKENQMPPVALTMLHSGSHYYDTSKKTPGLKQLPCTPPSTTSNITTQLSTKKRKLDTINMFAMKATKRAKLMNLTHLQLPPMANLHPNVMTKDSKPAFIPNLENIVALRKREQWLNIMSNRA